jgi:formylglycine-generating enzyme required for sulfatase activity
MMGCSPGDIECDDNEKPAHEVTITMGFWMGQTVVTVGAWKSLNLSMPPEPQFSVMYSNGESGHGWANDQQPIVNVSWAEAKSFCEASDMRLPTEAEWEYAARAGTKGARYGNLVEIAWYADNSGNHRFDGDAILRDDPESFEPRSRMNGNWLHAVGLKRPNAWNLHDMLGNVCQWTGDGWGEKYYELRVGRDPLGPPAPPEHISRWGNVVRGTRVLRGGSWDTNQGSVRVSVRHGSEPGVTDSRVGFRCVSERIPGDFRSSSQVPSGRATSHDTDTAR